MTNDHDIALFHTLSRDRDYWKLRALAAIAEGQLQQCAGNTQAVEALFRTAIVIGSGLTYNKTLKTLTEICNHAKQDAHWHFDQPDPAVDGDGSLSAELGLDHP